MSLCHPGLYVGGHNEFTAYARHYYNVELKLEASDYQSIADENASFLAADKEKALVAARLAIEPLKVVITSAAGNTAYCLLQQIGSRKVFGDQELLLCLFDSQDKICKLEGVAMEITDCAFGLVRQVQTSSDIQYAFKDAQAVIIIEEGCKSLTENAERYKTYGKTLDEIADRDVKVVAYGLHSLPLTFVLSSNAPSLSIENFTVVSRLLEMQTKSQIAQKLNINTSDVRDVVIWGNNQQAVDESDVQPLIDVKRARVHNYIGAISGPPVYSCSAVESLHNNAWVEKELNQIVLKEFEEICGLRKAMPTMSASVAIAEHIKDWWVGRQAGFQSDHDIVTVGLISKGWFDTPVGLVCSFPVRLSEEGGKFVVAAELEMSEESKQQFGSVVQQLMQLQNSLKLYCP
jgi:malate/lactate dehydrogenase